MTAIKFAKILSNSHGSRKKIAIKLTFGRFVGDLDGVLQDGDREALVGHGAEEETEVLVNDGVGGTEALDDRLHAQHPGGCKVTVLGGGELR